MDGSIQKYEAFVTAVDCGSFTKAAAVLGYAQSSVSKMIQDLEKDWNITLLERSRAGIQLTSEGTAMLPYIRTLLESSRRVQEQADSLSGLVTGIIRIGSFSSVAQQWVPKVISHFQADYPGIRYELLMGDYDEIEGWIREGRVDCGFLPLPAADEFEEIALEKDEYAVVLPEDHPLSGRKMLHPEDLDGQPFMLLEHGGRTEVSEWLEEMHVKPDVRFTTWDDYAILSMVENGLGISILPKLILRKNPYQVVIRECMKMPCRNIGLVMRKGAASAAVKKFVQYLKYRNT